LRRGPGRFAEAGPVTDIEISQFDIVREANPATDKHSRNEDY